MCLSKYQYLKKVGEMEVKQYMWKEPQYVLLGG
jgi:hypothetical protein